jgi:hypothetical protein
MAKILSVHPVKWEGMKNHWWQFVSVLWFFPLRWKFCRTFEAYAEAAGMLIKYSS